ncbi:deoxyribonucleoside regulator [Paraliobacillus ryukyuensis]|uniref:DNA-binding transcriptional regulator LsrR (DeoR family) n=1 Tax=Paraliobacillus ryukyuensis TaxID=200904 RepID=A0A366EDZ7_9BACI|nr:sugar-binding transcriptional regulator [Paraliobacillus ryukyuensis]RBP00644.1 DNA-binding transcriptional regulator LsrR (DeoR family) [Paraliobacillus ryukyuensis]
MVNWEEQRQLVKIATLYHYEDWTQEQIAKKFGISRPIVSKLLHRAKDQGMVEVYIKNENVHTVNLERKLEEHFHLREAVVVPSPAPNLERVTNAVGRAGAHYLSKKIKSINSLGISWGNTLAELVKEFPYVIKDDIQVVPLEGGMGRKRADIHANQLAYELAKKMNGTCSYLYAPAIVETKELKDRLMQMSDINDVIEEGKQVDTALISLGTPYQHSTLQSVGYLQEQDVEQLKEAGVVGEIGFRFYDRNGTPIHHSLEKEYIGVALEDIKKIDEVIGIVAGSHKVESVLAALKEGYVNVLVIDDQTASKLISEIE